MANKIYIALSTFAQQGPEPLNILKESGLDFDINTTGQRLTKSEVIKYAQGAQGIIAGIEPYDAQVLESLAGLKCISRCGVGVDNIDIPKSREKNIAVLNTPDVVVQPVAELAIGMMLDLLRRLSSYNALMRQKKWERRTGNLLSGKKVAIVGLGRIGRRVAEMLRAWNVEIYGVDIKPDMAWARQHKVKLVSLDQALVDADILSLHVASTPEHPFRLSEAQISRMKKGAFLVNVARGNLVDETALVAALKGGHLSGAALDVFEQEPYKGPLCDLENVVLTPHVATLTQESRLAMEIEATQNIIRFFNHGAAQ